MMYSRLNGFLTHPDTSCPVGGQRVQIRIIILIGKKQQCMSVVLHVCTRNNSSFPIGVCDSLTSSKHSTIAGGIADNTLFSRGRRIGEMGRAMVPERFPIHRSTIYMVHELTVLVADCCRTTLNISDYRMAPVLTHCHTTHDSWDLVYKYVIQNLIFLFNIHCACTMYAVQFGG